MLTTQEEQIAMRYLPVFLRDKAEPMPIKQIGVTFFREAGKSESFANLTWNPGDYGAEMIVEYAIYFDYDIQHLYDLEHAWVAVDGDGKIVDCWCSFHGMRLRAGGAGDLYTMRDGRPVLYIQPGKHALMPDARLFGLHAEADTCCNVLSGGGLLVPPMLRDRMKKDPAQDAKIRAYIRENLAFKPAWEFEPEQVTAAQLTDWPSLLDAIPGYVAAELERIGA